MSQKNPLHITQFPSAPLQKPLLTSLETSLILSSTLDIFQARATANNNSGVGLVGDYGLLHAIDERLAAYGFETNTGVRFIALVDLRGRVLSPDKFVGGKASAGTISATSGIGNLGMRDGELKAVFRAMQSAYIQLLQNPFLNPDDLLMVEGNGSKKITSPKFIDSIQKLGKSWVPEGVTKISIE